MAQKKKTDIAPVDLEPVELDPPDPALERWEKLAYRTDDINIYHGGDASRVIGIPRPDWSDPDEDGVYRAAGQAVYQTTPARVALSLKDGFHADSGTTLVPSRLVVRGFLGYMAGEMRGVEVRLITPGKGKTYADDKPWVHTPFSLTISEARELADVLLAAVDVLGGAE